MINKLIDKLKAEYPDSKCSLNYENPFQLLIATILAAQCTDERVNIVTKDLFKKYKTVEDFANADLSELEKDIKSTGFYHNKAKNIMNCSKTLLEKFNGEIPKTMEEMVTLPGVGRKTANVVLQDGFGLLTGVVVDTHCKRLANRLGLTKNQDPDKIEQDLLKIVPVSDWSNFGHLLVYHGRAVCDARKPRCETCIINEQCPKIM